MSAKNNTQRVFILVIVAVFFLTSVAITISVIIDAARGNDQQAANSQLEDAQKQLKELEDQQPKEGALEGTKLSNFEPVENVEKLEIIDLKPGSGEEVAKGATVTAHYTGALAKNGTIFQSSKDTGQPFTAPLDGVIPGWQQGIPGMKVGGVRRLVIPAELAYGAQSPSPNIPANSDLVFDIELIDTK